MTRTRIVPNVSATIDGHEWIVTGGGHVMRDAMQVPHALLRAMPTDDPARRWIERHVKSHGVRAFSAVVLPTQLAIRLDERALAALRTLQERWGCSPSDVVARAVQHVAKLDAAARRPHDEQRNARHSEIMRERWAAMTPEQRRAKQPLGGGRKARHTLPDWQPLMAACRTQTEIARQLDTDKLTVSEWTRGRRRPSRAMQPKIRALAASLGVTSPV